MDLQLMHKDFLRDHGDARALRVVAIPAHRGMITDRRGEPLAVSTTVNSVWATPRNLLGAGAALNDLANLLALAPDELRRLLAERRDREFVYLKRHIDPELAARVSALGLPGVNLQREYRRYYPAGEVAAHLIGFTNIDDVGQEGIELAYDAWLRGAPGAKRVLQDRMGRVMENVENIEAPRPGQDLALSIDRRIQYLAYRELKAAVLHHQARGGSIIVLDALTGEVLALASQPSYNPNNRGGLKADSLRNRALTDVFEPGSTLKPFTIAAALESGRYTPAQTVDTRPGHFKVSNHTIRDISNYGVIDVASVIKKSSNVGASKIALSLEPRWLWDVFQRVGLGRVTGSGFPGEAAGLLHPPGDWSELELATAAFGYGMSVTALQLAQAYMVLANDGLLRPVSLVRQDLPVTGQRVMSAAVVAQIRAMLESVTEPDGTGRHARVQGYRVAGKTGTVHKVGSGGYATDRYLSLFTGFAPASRPRLLLVVSIDEPQGSAYYGGQVAAPIFARVMEGALRLMNIPPDDLPALARPVLAQAARGEVAP
jgi:cell division protein FtsI (penicillin-binding protein 3)